MEHATLLLILAAVFGLFMAWGIGANDVANAMATSVGSKALTIKSAIIIAAIFEFSGPRARSEHRRDGPLPERTGPGNPFRTCPVRA